jgi:hypothetical protein
LKGGSEHMDDSAKEAVIFEDANGEVDIDDI